MRRLRRVLLGLALAWALVLAVSAAALSGAGLRLSAAAGRAQALASRVAAEPGALTGPEAGALVREVREVRDSVRLARLAYWPWRGLGGLAADLRLLPAEVGQVGPLLDFAAPLSEAAVEATEAARRVATAFEQAPAEEPIGTRIGRAVPAAASPLAAARRALSEAQAARGAVRTGALAGRLAPARRVVEAYDRVVGRYPAAVALALDAPAAWAWIAGSDAPRTYHVLGQNVDELRATGGFLASAGEVTVHNGAVTQLYQGNPAELHDASRPPIEPPRPLREYMGLGSWQLQDANWWADFPTSAAQADALWRRGPPSDGTLAADDAALARLVAALGPISVPDVPEPVTGANLAELIATNVYAGATQFHEGQAIQERKSRFLAQLFGALLAKALDPPPDRRVALATAVLQAFQNKELLLTLDDPSWAAALRELGWDGRLPPAEGDFVYLAETTVSYTKLARRMRTEVDYAVALDDRGGIRRSRITLRAQNRFSATEVPSMYPSFYFGLWWNPATRREETHLGRYAGYYRFYVPRGTVLLGGDGWDGPLDYTLDESGRAVVGGYLVVDPGRTREAALSIVPPEDAGARNGRYSLLVPSQPGAGARTVRVRLTAPAGFALAPAEPAAGTATRQGKDGAGQPWLEWDRAAGGTLELAAGVRAPGVAGTTR